jgi:hypothetical protein
MRLKCHAEVPEFEEFMCPVNTLLNNKSCLCQLFANFLDACKYSFCLNGRRSFYSLYVLSKKTLIHANPLTEGLSINNLIKVKEAFKIISKLNIKGNSLGKGNPNRIQNILFKLFKVIPLCGYKRITDRSVRAVASIFFGNGHFDSLLFHRLHFTAPKVIDLLPINKV